jgi:predicted TIM-barrel fold metal-dependent hydrolase
MKTLLLSLLLLCGAARAAPAGDFHQHIFNPAMAEMIKVQPISVDDLAGMLDQAGMQRATLLSVAYIYGSPSRSVEEELVKVRAENDWTAAQAARYPGRLLAICSFNPLKDYALGELERCAKDPGLKHGIKLHFGNSDVQLEQPAHAEKLKQVFKAANAHGMAIIVHMRASISKKRPYGADQARVFLEQLLPQAPDVPVQVAHMASTGPGYDDPAAEAVLDVLAAAVERGDPCTRKLWFDVASLAQPGMPAEDAARLVKRIRQVGVQRVVYGSDSAAGKNLRPREAWEAFRSLPLKADEVERIGANLPPYWN